MRTITALAGAVALTLAAATQASAAEIIHEIAVVNGYGAAVVVYAEDGSGILHEVVRLEAGEVRLVETEIEGTDPTVRLHARPTNSAARYGTWGREGIVTDAIELSEEDRAVFWIAPELAKSQVEIRAR